MSGRAVSMLSISAGRTFQRVSSESLGLSLELTANPAA
jgi:hypothetical protein